MRFVLPLVLLCACEHGKSPKTLQCGARTAVEHRVLFPIEDLDVTAFIAFRTESPPTMVVVLDKGQRLAGGERPIEDALGQPACPQLDDTFTAELDGVEGELRGGGWKCSPGPIEEPLCEGLEVRFALADAAEPHDVITLRDDTGTLTILAP
jgi:hypothetical protein